MKTHTVPRSMGVLLVAWGLAGCSLFGGFGPRVTVVGRAKINVVAKQPPKQEEPPPPKPRRAKLVGKKIEISEKVMFEKAAATIKPDSHALLKDVADVLKQNRQVKKVRIEGHTDSDGGANYNKKLSQQRADSVKKFLVGLGIAESRLEAVGFGEKKPIADNKTPEGKEKNRRVEFNVIEQ